MGPTQATHRDRGGGGKSRALEGESYSSLIEGPSPADRGGSSSECRGGGGGRWWLVVSGRWWLTARPQVCIIVYFVQVKRRAAKCAELSDPEAQCEQWEAS